MRPCIIISPSSEGTTKVSRSLLKIWDQRAFDESPAEGMPERSISLIGKNRMIAIPSATPVISIRLVTFLRKYELALVNNLSRTEASKN